MFRKNARDRDTLTVEESDAKIPPFSLCVTDPDVCLRGFKGGIRKSLRSKQMMYEKGGNEYKPFF